MYKKAKYPKSRLKVSKAYEGESIEQKVQRILNNKEPITDGAPTIYTERKDGVLPAYDIRTDKWDVALDAMDKVAQSRINERTDRQKSTEELAKEGKVKDEKGRIIKMKHKDQEGKKDSGAEPIQGTDKK